MRGKSPAMREIERIADRAARLAGLALVVGGIGFILFWSGSAIDLEFPWALSLAIHGATILALVTGVVGLERQEMRKAPRPRLGQIGAALIVVGLLTILELALVGTIVLGLSILSSHRLPHLAGLALALGGLMLLGVFVGSGNFGSEGEADPEGFVLTVALLGIAALGGGWAWLGAALSTEE
jgi:hypothetical protein